MPQYDGYVYLDHAFTPARHCFKFAARGVNFPEIYIGKSGENYELSLYTQETSRCSF